MMVWLVLIGLLWWVSPVAAATFTAATCSNANVQTKIDEAMATGGDTVSAPHIVQIPNGNCTWTAGVNVPNTKGIIIQGTGQSTTTITYNAGGQKLFNLNLKPGNAVLEIKDLTLNNNHISFVNLSMIEGYGNGTACFSCYRFHHITITNLNANGISMFGHVGTGAQLSGLIDHNTCRKTSSSDNPHCFRIDSSPFPGDPASETAFSFPMALGTNQMTYIEQNTIDYSGVGGSDGGTDFFTGSQIVLRNNTVTGTELCGWHGSDSGYRGIHSYECYRNIMNGQNVWASIGNMRSGTGMTFQNTATNYTTMNIYSIYRIPPGNGAVWSLCNGSVLKDGNTGTGSPRPLGYPCTDQHGWFFGTGADPAFTLTPNYHWLNTLNGVVTDPQYPASYVIKNVEFYSDVSASCTGGGSCTTGIGIGTTLPTSCTTGVGFWKTNEGTWNQSGDGLGQGVLYKCTSTNTWTLHYAPYAYPHPLQGATGGPNLAPAAPTGVTIQ